MTLQRLTASLSGSWLVALALMTPAHAGDVATDRDDQPAPVAPDTDAPGETEPDAEQRPKGYFQIGAGLSPDEGFVFAAAIVQPDLFRTGHSLALSSELSALRQEFRIGYEAPKPLGAPFDVSAELFDTRRRYPRVERHGVGGEVTVSTSLGPATTGYVAYRLERVDATPAGGELRPRFATAPGGSLIDPWRGGLVSSVRAGLIYDTVEPSLFPRRGTRAEVFTETADERLGSEVDFRRAGANLAHHTPLGPFTLHLRGALEAIESPTTVPLAHRLYLDGHADVRGFGLDSFPPYGGTMTATGRAELEFPLIPSLGLYGAVFYDAGVIADRDGLSGSGYDVAQSAGASLIWRSPIGLIRLDVAVPLSDSGETMSLVSIGL